MSVGPWQIILIVVVVLLLFGPKRIPGIGRSLGEAIRGFKKGVTEDKDDERDVTPDQEKLNENEGQSATQKQSESEKA